MVQRKPALFGLRRPNTVEDRFRFLLACFLDGEEYFKLDDLSEELYVSSKTLSAELRQVEFVLGSITLP